MPSSPEPARRTYRSNLDLVASDEMLSRLLIGLARLRAELEACQRGAGKPIRAAAVDMLTAAPSGAAKRADDHSVWFYADDGAQSAEPALAGARG